MLKHTLYFMDDYADVSFTFTNSTRRVYKIQILFLT